MRFPSSIIRISIEWIQGVWYGWYGSLRIRRMRWRVGRGSEGSCRFHRGDSHARHRPSLSRSLRITLGGDSLQLCPILVKGRWQIHRAVLARQGRDGLRIWSCTLCWGRILLSWGTLVLWVLLAVWGRSPIWRTFGWRGSSPYRRCWIFSRLAPLGSRTCWWWWVVALIFCWFDPGRPSRRYQLWVARSCLHLERRWARSVDFLGRTWLESWWLRSPYSGKP